MSRGVAWALGAYLIWGLSPLYWRALEEVPPGDILAWRVVSTLTVLALVHLVGRTGRTVWARVADARVRRTVLVTAGLLAANWLTFIWAVNAGRVLEASLGYFVNPLVSVALGVVVLGERLRPAQWVAVGLAGAGVAWLSLGVGTVPWVSLVLAGTFGLYGLLRKTAPVGSLDGLSLEVATMAPVALVVVGARAAAGAGVVGPGVGTRTLLVLGSGLLTAAPLLLFAGAARRIDLSLVGVMQYVAPTLQFLCGVLVFGEAWEGARAVGYVVVWVALAVYAVEGLWWARRRRVPATPALT